jgi:uncharacterized membrane protein
MRDDVQNASAARLRALAAEGAWTREQAAAVECLMRRNLPWRKWLERLLLALGAGLLLAGVIFFFAYNWRAITPFQKFAIVQGAMLACATAAWLVGLQRTGGKILLGAACVLVGVFLAVFGQVYQTGADAWQLFAGWAGLILPWLLLARSGSLWLGWLGLVNLGVTLWWSTLQQQESAEYARFAAAMGLLNGAFLALREFLLARGTLWLRPGGTRKAPVGLAWAWFTVAGCAVVFGKFGSPAAIALGIMLLAVAVNYLVYRFRLPDLFALAAMAFSLCIVLSAATSRALLEGTREFVGTFLLTGLVILGIFTGAVALLRGIHRAMRLEKEVAP